MSAVAALAPASPESRASAGLEAAAAVLRDWLNTRNSAAPLGDDERDRFRALIQDVVEAEVDVRSAQRIYMPLAEQALALGEHAAVEALAIRTLLYMPRFGGANRLLAESFAAQGLDEEAAICHRYGLPSAVLDRHFSDQCFSTADIRDHHSGVSRLDAYGSMPFYLHPPRQWRARDIREMSAASMTIAPARTYSIESGKLFFDTFNSTVWNHRGEIVRELCRGFPEIVQASVASQSPLKLTGTVCLLGNRNAKNYYHWMNDVLPRLAVLEASGIRLEEIDHFVLEPLVHPFHHETLATLGIEADRLHFTTEAEYVEADRLMIPVYGSNSLGMAQGPWNPAFLKRRFLGRDEGAELERDLMLYVSRGTEGARSITNDPDVIAMLEPLGFTVLRAEEHSVSEQAALFARARVVLGPHGAGLSNIVFCRPGTTVIELFQAHIEPCFWVLSEQCGLEHHVHFCGEFDEQNRPSSAAQYHATHHQRRDSAFSVELGALADVLRHANLSGAPRS